MKLKMIVAMDSENGIGLNNTLPWYYSNDLKYFSKVTKGNGNNAIVMGKNTWLSLPKKPLPKRDNIILSTTEKYEGMGYETVDNIELLKEKIQKYDEIWIIGGANIYKQFINDIDLTEIHISKIDRIYNCDTFFPEISEDFILKTQGFIDNDIILEILERK